MEEVRTHESLRECLKNTFFFVFGGDFFTLDYVTAEYFSFYRFLLPCFVHSALFQYKKYIYIHERQEREREGEKPDVMVSRKCDVFRRKLAGRCVFLTRTTNGGRGEETGTINHHYHKIAHFDFFDRLRLTLSLPHPVTLLLPAQCPDRADLGLNFPRHKFSLISINYSPKQAANRFAPSRVMSSRRRLSQATQIHAAVHYDVHLNLRKL